MTLLPQADRFFDSPSDNPYWNESVWFSISIPERRIHGAIQYYFRPNMNMLNGGPFIWDATGTNTWNCLYYNWSHLQHLPQGAEKFDMRANNSLAVKVIEPLQTYRIQYDNEGLVLDLEWQAIAPMHQLRSKDPGQQSTQKFHIEQPGRMKGLLRLDGTEWEVDCYSMRDTSYGPRDYSSSSVGGYFWGISEHSAFHAIAKGEGSLQTVIGGFIWEQGELASIVEGQRDILSFGRYGPKRVRFTAKDTLGRRIEALGDIDDGFIFTGYTDHTVVWSLTQWDWGGVEHWGDSQEFCPATRFRRIARGDLTLG